MIATFLAATLLAPAVTATVRVDGDGYFRLAKAGSVLFARQLTLVATQSGLATQDGATLLPRTMVPAGATRIEIGLEGEISAYANGSKQAIGRVALAMFGQRTPFTPAGNYVKTNIKPSLANPGEGLAGVIRMGSSYSSSKTPVKTNSSYKAAQTFVEPKAEIRVNMTSEIEGDVIRMDSIAEIQGENALVEKLKTIEFGRAPIIGSYRGMTVMQVRAMIAASGIDIRDVTVTVPAGAQVMRKSQKIDETSLNDSVKLAMQKKLGFETDLTLKTRISQSALPIGKVVYDVAQVKLDKDIVYATVDVTVDGKLANTLSLSYEVTGLAQVKRGEIVRLRMISNAARVEVSAKAKSSAFMGQKITVETDSGAQHTGILIGPSLVEVRL